MSADKHEKNVTCECVLFTSFGDTADGVGLLVVDSGRAMPNFCHHLQNQTRRRRRSQQGDHPPNNPERRADNQATFLFWM